MPPLLRNLLVIAALAVAALAITWLTFRPAEQSLPAGSSRSSQPDGTRALYLWLEALGVRTQRLEEPEVSASSPPSLLFVVQPQTPVTALDGELFDRVPAAGGTLVLVGTNLFWDGYASTLGVRAQPAPISTTVAAPSLDAELPLRASHRLRADDAEPLLLAPTGDWVALRKPYREGTLVVVAALGAVSNEGLKDERVARWLYREIVEPLGPGALVAFDESHYQVADAAASPRPDFSSLVLGTPVGRAVVYAAGLTFVFLLLANRRLGPPLPAVDPGRGHRTMHEHVQALAGLYRRARQLRYLRAHFGQHYRRVVARALGVDVALLAAGVDTAAALIERGVDHEVAARVAGALARIDAARDERQLMAAVQQVEDALESLPRFGRHATLSAA